jgi:DNA-binding NarL/FixJ family response regulator
MEISMVGDSSDTAIARHGALTKREQQVAALVTLGFSNKHIAAKLDLSEGTVKQHLHSIFRKLGVRNRREFIKSHQPREPHSSA